VKRLLFLILLVLAGALPSTASAGGPTMLIGAAEDAVRQPTLVGAKAQMDLLTSAGLNAVRLTQVWAPGQTAPTQADVDTLQNVAEAAHLDGVQVFLVVMNFGSRTTPLTEQDRQDFASYAAAIARAVPDIRRFVIGNEPNLNRYWLPQFDLDGSDAAAAGYEALLADTYDALKAVSPNILVLGGALSPHGGDDPTSIRLTHSPTAFITDMGTVYRNSGRTKPIMDGLAIHPYEDNSSIAPVNGKHPNSTTIAIADYDKLVSLLGNAFDGTSQRGSTLPIYYTEFGVESQIPATKASLYTGQEIAAVKPVSESVQGDYYRQAIELAFCQPNVRGFFIFHTIDESDLNRWQSGLFYVDGKPKSDLPFVRTAVKEAHRGVVTRCQSLALTPRASLGVVKVAARVRADLRCDIDCTYALTVRAAGRTVRQRRGVAIGGTARRVALGSLRPGRYTIGVSLTAPVNPGRTRSLTRRFTVP
jgi:hypothetical protein